MQNKPDIVQLGEDVGQHSTMHHWGDQLLSINCGCSSLTMPGTFH